MLEKKSETLAKIEQLKNELIKLQNEVVSEVKNDLENIKELDGVKRISKNPSMFTISFSELSKDWNLSPRHYDLPSQAKGIIDRIEELEKRYGAESYEKIRKLFDDICKTKSITTNAAGKISLHENVVETVEELKKRYFKE